MKSLTQTAIAADTLPTPRLLKNYLLILGRIDPGAVAALALNYSDDPLLATAHNIACNGSVVQLFLKDEPEVLRKHYYSTRFEPFDDRSEGSM